jgi:hypothetical protein
VSESLDPGVELLAALVDTEDQDGEPLQVIAFEEGTLVCGVQTSRELLEELTDRGHVKLHTSVKGGGTLTVTPEGRSAVKRLREPVPETAVSLDGDQIDRVVRATIECVERSAKEQVTPAEIAMRLSVEVDGALLLRLRMAASNGLLHEGVSSAGEETYTPTRAALQQHRGWSAGAQELLATRLMEEMDRALDARIESEPPDSPVRKALEAARREIAALTRTAGGTVAQELAKGNLPT